jgi:hypothetical protein
MVHSFESSWRSTSDSLQMFQTSLLEFVHDDSCRHMIEPSTLGRAIELNGQAAPPLDRALLFLGFEHNGQSSIG